MKPLTLKISLVVSFSLILLSAFGQIKKTKVQKTTKAPADTLMKQVKANQHAVDSLSNSLKESKTKIDSSLKALNKKADTLKKSLKKIDSTVATAKKTDSAGMGKYRGKSFVFQKPIRLVACDEVGRIDSTAKQPIAPKGTTFTVESVKKNGQIVISFWIWSLRKPLSTNLDAFENQTDSTKKDSLFATVLNSANTLHKQKKISEQMDVIAKRESFNFKKYADKQYVPASIDSANDNKRYFLIGKDTLTDFCAAYKEVKNWDINYGVLVTTFKLRFNRFSFSNNLSLGGAVYYQRKMKRDTDFTWGIIGALSLSSVTLDSSTTNLHKKPFFTTSTTRPAFSPSVHYAISYKKINLTVGIGWDLLSKPTDAASATATNPEAGWIYNNKPWLGIGLGYNIFTNSAAKATPNDAQQAPGK